MGRLTRFGAIVGMAVLAGAMPALAQQKTLTVAAYGGVWDSHLRKEVFPEFEKKHGVKVEYVAGNSTDTLAKLQAQKGNQVPGILSGAVIVFALAASAFATPSIIGGRRLKVASTLAYDEFLNTLNWPLGAAVAVLLLFALVAIVWGANRLVERRYAQVFG